MGQPCWCAWHRIHRQREVCYRDSGQLPGDDARCEPRADADGNALQTPDVGTPIYYAPRNTYFQSNADAGSSVSTENQASALAGLKGLKYILEQKGSASKHYPLVADIDTLIAGIEQYFVAAWSQPKGFFRQGGTYHPAKKEWKWVQGDSP